MITIMLFLMPVIFYLVIALVQEKRFNRQLHTENEVLKGNSFPSQSIRLVSSGSITENDNHYRLDENYMRNRN